MLNKNYFQKQTAHKSASNMDELKLTECESKKATLFI